MNGPKILWDAHNYLAIDLAPGRPYDSDLPELSVDDHNRAELAIKAIAESGVEVSITVPWEDDPMEFANRLNEAGNELKALCLAVAGTGIPFDHFHFRSDID